MFGNLIGEKTDYKVDSLTQRALSDFRFFSKVSDKTESVFDIAKSIQETSNWGIKSLKTQKLRSIIEEASIADLIKYMKSDNEIIRSIAAQCFADCESPNLINCLEIMMRDESENLRISCLETLSNIEDARTLDLFEKAMKDNSANVRIKAAIGLAEIARTYNSSEAINILNNHINDPDAEVREFIIDELGLIGNENSLTQLFKAMDQVREEDKELVSESLSIILSKALS